MNNNEEKEMGGSPYLKFIGLEVAMPTSISDGRSD